MIYLLLQKQYALFAMLIFALVFSLTFHEFGHAFVAKRFGDDTAERAGRLTLNPLAHIDVMGLVMVILIGFGYAKPVPTDPSNFSSEKADFWVSAAGPFMNLLVAVVSWNFFLLMTRMHVEFFINQPSLTFFLLLAKVNLLLMLFNLLPIAPLDGHYMIPYVVPRSIRPEVVYFNRMYGPRILLGLVILSVLGIPIFTWVSRVGNMMLPLISWVGGGAAG